MSGYKDKQNDEKRIKELLREALPPVASDAEPARDLWPALLRRLDNGPGTEAAPARTQPRSIPAKLPWFDWALIAGLIVFAAFFPATVPVLLYYL
jgi:hypothetical protein